MNRVQENHLLQITLTISRVLFNYKNIRMHLINMETSGFRKILDVCGNAKSI